MQDQFLFDNITDENFIIYAAKNYYNPKSIDSDDFFEDLSRFRYIKRLFNRYINKDELSERLILNHLIIIFNSFGYDAGIKMLGHKLEIEYWSILKPFLIFLKAIDTNELTEINMDKFVIDRLREI